MAELKVIDVNKGVFELNDKVAAENRRQLKAQKTFMVNVMASPGAGKTTTLLHVIQSLKDKYKIGVMEADIDATVDAETMEKAGVRTIQVHTNGECAMDAEMTMEALREFPTEDLDVLFLENIGNLVCPAETDTGSSINLEILSVPEGDDKPLKYPLMFTISNVVLINKIDTKEYFPFDDDALVERVHNLNPDAKIFFASAKTGEGMDAFEDYLREQIDAWNK
ncbi:MAG: hydrogenase nickel incorporation protein HypB [Oscillospiraceae bacterium]|nr:hydrogenase nickel incorporation protein HypB [Oscillospiraceae bacterium]